MHRLDIAIREAVIADGVRAAQQGKALSSNPHASSSPEYEAWRTGWFRYVNAEQESREGVTA